MIHDEEFQQLQDHVTSLDRELSGWVTQKFDIIFERMQALEEQVKALTTKERP